MVEVELLLFRIGLLVIASAFLALILQRFKQPPLVSYLLIGVLISFFGLDLSQASLAVMIEFGIILLLFMAGLQIKLTDVLSLGKKTFIIGEGHDILMGIVGFAIAYYPMGLSALASFYVAVGVTLSSTIVVVKILKERKELASPHGKILVGTMVLQDILAMLFLVFVTSLDSGTSVFGGVASAFVKILATLIVFYYLGKYVLTPLFKYAASSIELVFLLGLAWCFVGIGAAHLLSFSLAIGAFIAGISVAHLPFTFEITDKIRALQDFGIMLFFLSIGMQISITKELFLDPYFYVLTIFVLLFTPIATGLISSFLFFTKKEIFILSLLPTQISEFTLIILAMGVKLGHVSTELFSMVTMIVIITIAFTSGTLPFIALLYKSLAPYLGFLEWRLKGSHHQQREALNDHVVIMGFKKLGQEIASHYKNTNRTLLVVEWQPELLELAKNQGLEIAYGDAGDSDLWDEYRFQKAHLIVSTIGENQDDDINLLRWLKRKNSTAQVVLETNNEHESKQLYDEGASYVLVHDHLEWQHLHSQFLPTLRKTSRSKSLRTKVRPKTRKKVKGASRKKPTKKTMRKRQKGKNINRNKKRKSLASKPAKRK